MNGDKKTIAIIGNPNSGKTTLFNRLTGSNQHVGNWPGVTVDRKTGHICHDGAGIDIVDLPGIYSLSPYTQEEIIAREFVLSDELDGILNIVDAANIERNLYLTLQLVALGHRDRLRGDERAAGRAGRADIGQKGREYA